MNSKYSKKQLFTLFIYCVINCLCSFCSSLQGPFYPIVAEKKGASPSQYGIVFGIFSLFLFIFCLISGMLIRKFGAVKISLTGVLTIGIATVAFGFVDKIDDSSLFIGISVIIRAFEGMGYAMSRNAAISIVSFEFSDNVEMAFAAMQAFSSIGHQIGPVTGGALFELGGFILPFLFTGSLLLSAAFIVLFLPKNFLKQEKMFDKQMLEMFKMVSVIEGIFTVFGVYFIIGFIITTYEPHLKSLNLSPIQIGLVFFSMMFAYCVSSFGWSKLCQIYDSPEYINFFALCITICGLILLGPAPYLPFNLTIRTSVISLIILGIGIGGEQITGFSLLNKGNRLAFLSQNTQTHGIVATIYTASLALGNFMGPLLGGYLFDIFGFAWSAHFFIFYQVVFLIWIIIYRCFCQRRTELSAISSSKEGKTTYKSFE